MKIAIQGHPTRGKEVIQILESLGGKKLYYSNAFDKYLVFFIDDKGYISCFHHESPLVKEYFKIYTLEEFEKEFPFKVGDKVRDCSDNEIGTILGFIDIDGELMYVVNFEKSGHANMPAEELKPYKEMERNIKIGLKKAKEWYKKGGELKEIALQAFTEKELTKVDLPKTWEEYTQQHFHREGYVLTHLGDIAETTVTGSRGGENLCPSKKSAEAHLAMIQLEQLRNCWWNGWKPDWNDDQQTKYCIVHSQEFKIHILYETRRFLSFPTIEMAKEFLECFKDLIERAGYLI